MNTLMKITKIKMRVILAIKKSMMMNRKMMSLKMKSKENNQIIVVDKKVLMNLMNKLLYVLFAIKMLILAMFLPLQE